MERIYADQIALAPYVQSGDFCWFYHWEEMPWGGKEGYWYELHLGSGKKEKLGLKTSECLAGEAVAASEGRLFYYQDRYPERAFYQYDPMQKEKRRLLALDQALGSFQVDGEWLFYVTEPEPGVLDQPECFHGFNFQTQEQRCVVSTQVCLGRLSLERHQRWYVRDGKLFWVCENDCWTDEEGQSLRGWLVCYALASGKISRVAKCPAGLQVQKMLLKAEKLWILGAQENERFLYEVSFLGQETSEMREVLRISNDSYCQLMDVQLWEQGLFWLYKERHSLLENSTSLWWLDDSGKEPVLMVRLSDFRALDVRFQPVGGFLYYQDNLWKEPYCTPLDAPETKEKVVLGPKKEI